jgi:hypothetical protein
MSRSDDSQLPELLRRTLVHHDVRELSADKAYSTHDNHEVLDQLGIEPYIAFQDHAVVNLKYPIWSRHLCEFLFNLDKFKQHFHRRSNVETTFDMIKAKFGASVTARLPMVLAGRAHSSGADAHAGQERAVSGLTTKEQRAVRTALRFLRLRVGAWAPLAKAPRYQWDSIQKVVTGRRAVTPALALRVARFVVVS